MREYLYFDLETTGVDTEKDRIVSIAFRHCTDSMCIAEQHYYVNPGIPIPKEASEVHGITDEMVAKAPKFSDLSSDLLKVFSKDVIVVGYNSTKFDIPLLINEFSRVGIDWKPKQFLDVLSIERKITPMDLSSVFLRRTGTELEQAHDALADVVATETIFKFQKQDLDYNTLLEYSESDSVVDWGGKFKKDEDGNIIFGFGKYFKQVVMSDPNHRGFLQWMLTKDFPEDTLRVCRELLNG